MNTFLLYWNPFFSSYKLDRFLDEFDFYEGRDVLRNDENDWDRSPNEFDWSVIQHEKAHKGDRFFFIRVGYEKSPPVLSVPGISSPSPSKTRTGPARDARPTI